MPALPHGSSRSALLSSDDERAQPPCAATAARPDPAPRTPEHAPMTASDRLIQHRRATQLDAAPELIDPRTALMATLPLLGRISAGQPLEAIEDPDWVEVPEQLAQRAEFALRVRGDSMTEDQIEDGDLILVKRQATATNGEVVVALIDGEAADPQANRQ
ncbi:MAG: hypothetical protein C1943_05685 [Halochromatium sp.]|nr:hypothetical protein [Halochromatium sp.]